VSDVNVNLKACPCPSLHRRTREELIHGPEGCPASPVLIPCHIPRSVTFEVALGECAFPNMCGATCEGHHPDCPARPSKVACSISGKTWEESEVDGASIEIRGVGSPSHLRTDDAVRLFRDRWALIKALVLGGSKVREVPESFRVVPAVSEMMVQRSAVYAALADMARAEEAALQAQLRVDEAFPFFRFRRNDADHREERPSIGRLGVYVEHLIEQVGVLP